MNAIVLLFAVIGAAALSLLVYGWLDLIVRPRHGSWRHLWGDLRGAFGQFPTGGVGPVATLASLTNADNLQTVPVFNLPDGFSVWVTSEGAFYRLDKLSGATIFSPNVVSAFGGPASARWFRLNISSGFSGDVHIKPLGGGQDDTPNIYNTAAQCAGKCKLVLDPGVYNILTNPFASQPSGFISNTWLVFTPGVSFAPNLVAGDPSHAPLVAFGVPGTATTLAADNVVNAKTISVVAIPGADGTYVRLLDATNPTARAATYRILSHSGLGPFTLTLDRPVRYQFHAGDSATSIAPVQNLRIEGNGAILAGVCDRYVELQGALDCYIENLQLQVSASNTVADSFWMSIDNGSFRCEARGIIAAGTGADSDALLAIEASEACRYTLSSARGNTRALSSGFGIYDSVSCGLEQCTAFGNVFGAHVTATGNVLGSLECWIQGGEFSGNTTNGIQVDNGSTATWLHGCATEGNTTSGVSVGSTVPTAAFGTKITSLRSRNNGRALTIQSTSKGTTIDGIDMPDNTLGILANDNVQITGLTALSGNLNGVLLVAAGVTYLDRAVISAGGVTGGNVLELDSTSYVSNTVVTSVTNGIAAIHVDGNALARIRSTSAQGGAGTTGLSIAAGSRAIVEDDNDFSTTATPYAVAGLLHGSFIVTGDPNGQQIASIGSTAQRTDGGALTSFYVKEANNTTSAGWTGK